MISSLDEHELNILPQRNIGTDADAPAYLHVLLTDSGANIIIDKEFVIELNEITTVTDSATYTSYEWKTWRQSFTPEVTGKHWLELSVQTTGIPEIYIRVSNPSL